jgi:putative transposase
LIDFNHKKISVKRQGQLLKLHRSTAYYQSQTPTEPDQREIDIKNTMDRIHFKEPSYGCRRIRNELKKQGFVPVGKKLVSRYMQEMNIIPFYPGPNLSKRDLKARTYPYLLRGVPIAHANQVWGIDITYCGMPSGFMYMVTIIDWYSRFVVGWAISNTMKSDFVIRAVKDAVQKHGTPVIINSDQGSQFTSKDYIDCINSYETIKISMDGRGRATDNARTERFFRSFKWERLYIEYPETALELKQMTKKYMHHYNWNRPHQSLEDQTPASVYFNQNAAMAKAI